MTNTIFITLIFSAIMGALLFSGIVKVTKFTFGKPRTENVCQGEDVRDVQSRKAADIAEKNNQLMDRVRAQMEKNRR